MDRAISLAFAAVPLIGGLVVHNWTDKAVPLWAWIGLVVIAALLAVLAGVTTRALELETASSPQLEIQFDRNNPRFVHQTKNADGEELRYVAVRPVSLTHRAIEGCIGYLDAVYKLAGDGTWKLTEWISREQLEWGSVGFVEQRIDGTSFQPLNVFFLWSPGGMIAPRVEKTMRRDELVFSDRSAIYRLDIVVTARDAPAATISLRVERGADPKSLRVESL